MVSLDCELDKMLGEFVVIRAEENGVNVIGLTRGRIPGFTTLKNLTREKCF